MAIKQESVKLSIRDDCNGHDCDVGIKNNDDDDDYDDNDYHDNDDDDDDDDDDDKVITISKLNKRKPACQLLSGLMSRYRKFQVDKHNEWEGSLILFVKKYFYTQGLISRMLHAKNKEAC